MRPIGLLYDHVTENFGDRAIGISLAEALTVAGIPFEVVHEGSDTGRFSALLVGGGHCLRASGDRFYDRFRVPGRHILNAAGISQDADSMEFLKDYRYISVRTSFDYNKVSGIRPDAQIVPCSSLQMSGQSECGPEIEDRIILLHLPPACAGLLPGWVEVVEQAFPDYGKALLSINRFNSDHEYLADVACHKKWPLISGLSPGQMDSLIGHPNVHGLISTSLHGTMFALKHSKPFLALEYVEKIRFFLDDRGLTGRMWNNGTSPAVMRSALDPMTLDHRLNCFWRKDAATLNSHMTRIILECRAALVEDDSAARLWGAC